MGFCDQQRKDNNQILIGEIFYMKRLPIDQRFNTERMFEYERSLFNLALKMPIKDLKVLKNSYKKINSATQKYVAKIPGREKNELWRDLWSEIHKINDQIHICEAVIREKERDIAYKNKKIWL